jgi:hypothetical protein
MSRRLRVGGMAALSKRQSPGRDRGGGPKLARSAGRSSASREVLAMGSERGQVTLRPSVEGNSPLPVQEGTAALLTMRAMNEVERVGAAAARS